MILAFMSSPQQLPILPLRAGRALVTGGTKGIGLSIAKRLLADGYKVVSLYHRDEAAAAEARASGIEPVRCDVTSGSEVDALFESQSGFTVLVHAAGFTRDKLLMMMPESDFDDVIAVHLKAAFLVARRVIRHMIGERQGRIIFVISPSALRGRPGQTNYAAAKAGLTGMARSLAQEVGRFSITVNCISAGLVNTGLTEAIPAETKQELLASIPLGRMGRPEEIAAAASWLCRSGANYVTGQVLGVDGGIAM